MINEEELEVILSYNRSWEFGHLRDSFLVQEYLIAGIHHFLSKIGNGIGNQSNEVMFLNYETTSELRPEEKSN